MRCSAMTVKSDGGDDGGDYYDREGPARVSNTITSASSRALLAASLADLRVTAHSPADILSNGIISEEEERDGETAVVLGFLPSTKHDRRIQRKEVNYPVTQSRMRRSSPLWLALSCAWLTEVAHGWPLLLGCKAELKLGGREIHGAPPRQNECPTLLL